MKNEIDAILLVHDMIDKQELGSSTEALII